MQRDTETADEPLSRPPRAGRRPILVVVDDDSAVRDALADVLGDMGLYVETFARPDRALEHLRKGTRHIDLILLDLLMPGMTGAGFLRTLRAENLAAEVPVVLLSGTPDAARQVSGLGVNACLRKPVELGKLTQTLSMLLERPVQLP